MYIFCINISQISYSIVIAPNSQTVNICCRQCKPLYRLSWRDSLIAIGAGNIDLFLFFAFLRSSIRFLGHAFTQAPHATHLSSIITGNSWFHCPCTWHQRYRLLHNHRYPGIHSCNLYLLYRDYELFCNRVPRHS